MTYGTYFPSITIDNLNLIVNCELSSESWTRIDNYQFTIDNFRRSLMRKYLIVFIVNSLLLWPAAAKSPKAK